MLERCERRFGWRWCALRRSRRTGCRCSSGGSSSRSYSAGVREAWETSERLTEDSVRPLRLAPRGCSASGGDARCRGVVARSRCATVVGRRAQFRRRGPAAVRASASERARRDSSAPAASAARFNWSARLRSLTFRSRRAPPSRARSPRSRRPTPRAQEGRGVARPSPKPFLERPRVCTRRWKSPRPS